MDSGPIFYVYFNGDDDVFSTIREGHELAALGIGWYNKGINKQ